MVNKYRMENQLDMGKNIININGRQIITDGKSIKTVGSRIFIDGKEYTDEVEVINNEIKIVIEGTVENVDVDGDLKIIGDVKGNVDVKGSFAGNNIEGDVETRGNVSCSNVGGSVKASGNVICGKVKGNASAGGNMICN